MTITKPTKCSGFIMLWTQERFGVQFSLAMSKLIQLCISVLSLSNFFTVLSTITFEMLINKTFILNTGNDNDFASENILGLQNQLIPMNYV